MINFGKFYARVACRLVFLTFTVMAGMNISLLSSKERLDNSDHGRQPVSTHLQPNSFKRDLSLKGSSYLMALSYHDQFTTALKYEMLSLANVAADWGLKMVEPFVVNSRMYGLKNEKILPAIDRKQIANAIPLGSLINIKSFFLNCSEVEMTPFEEFRLQVPEEVILIYDATQDSTPPRDISMTTNRNLRRMMKMRLRAAGEGIMDCTAWFKDTYSSKQTFLTRLESSLQFNGRNPKVVKVICFDEKALLTTGNFKSHISSLVALQNTLVVFLNWRGCFIFDCSVQAYQKWEQSGECPACPEKGPNIHRYRLITNSSLTGYAYCTERPIPHSKETINIARRYLKMLKKSKPLIGIHLRTERLLSNGLNLHCLGNLLNNAVFRFFQLSNGVPKTKSDHLLVVSDYNPRGSDLCQEKKCTGVLKYLYRNFHNQWKVNVTTFRPELTGSPDHNGYAAAVEMNMLLNSDYLILVGHGNFQDQLAAHFLTNGKPSSHLLWIGRRNKCTLENVTKTHAYQ